jgi:phospholipase/carboxylesterase
MNRFALPAPKVSLPISLATHSLAATVDIPSRDPLRELRATPHTTFAPLHYEPGYAYPLVVWLHGAADNERQLGRVMPLVSMRNYVAIAPRGTRDVRERRGAFRWRQSRDDVELTEARVLDCLEIAQRRFHVHADRIFLAGYGCGGTMALRVAWSNPHRFAGVATIGGSLPSRNRPLRHVNAMRRLPCFLATARQSREFPEADVCQDLRLLHAVGGTVDLRQYPCGDELTTNMLADLDRWMMSIVLGESH